MKTKIVQSDAISLQEKLAVLQRITNTGDWEWDISDNIVTISDEACKIIGENENCKCDNSGTGCKSMTFDDYIQLIPSKDRVKILAGFSKAKKTGIFDVKHRLNRIDKKPCIVRFHGSIVHDEKTNKPLGMIGNISNITKSEHKHLSESVVRKIIAISLEDISLKAGFKKILRVIFAIPWISVESQGGIYLNDNKEKQLKLISHIGFHSEIIRQCSVVDHGYCLCGRAAVQKKTIFVDCLDDDHDVTFDGIKEHGHYCIPIQMGNTLLGLLNLYVPHGHTRTEEEEKILNVVANTLASLIDRHNKQRQLEMLAHYDPLTELPNWRFFINQIDSWVKHFNGKKGFSILFIDLDKFKTINDLLGHRAGDVLLQKVAKRLRRCIRQEDFLGRKSGDEFVIGVKVENASTVALIANKILKAMSKPFDLDGEEGIIGASVGISSFPSDGIDVEKLIQYADSAMFHAKNHPQ